MSKEETIKLVYTLLLYLVKRKEAIKIYPFFKKIFMSI